MRGTAYEKEIKRYARELTRKQYSAATEDFQCANKFNKAGLGLAREIWQLYRGPGGLQPRDYFMYQLYDGKYSAQDKRRFISDSLLPKIALACGDLRWHTVTEDKWVCYSVLQNAGLPIPRTLAVIDRSTIRSFGRERKIDSPAMLKDFLAGLHAFPVFAKPNLGVASLDVFMIIGMDGDRVLLEQAEPITVDDLFAKMIGTRTFLLQAMIQNHPDIRAISKYVPTVRTVNLVKDNEVVTPVACLKLPSPTSIADNYWRTGNLLADLDVDTGVIRRVVRGAGRTLEQLTDHPETGIPLIGRALPDWQQLRAVNDACARLVAPLRYHALDIALTKDGPQIVEINMVGSFVLPQMASGKGFLTDEVFEFLKSCGCKFRGRLMN